MPGRANISHLLTETSVSLTFSACLRWWSPRNFARSSEMKCLDAPVSTSACTVTASLLARDVHRRHTAIYRAHGK